MSKERTLNPKQEKFAQEVVLNGGDKVKARAAAGYSTKMSYPSQGVDADKLYNHAKISLRIAELQETQDNIAEKEFKIDSEFVLRRLKEIDELDVIDIIKDDMSGFKLLSEWPKVWRTSISSIDMKRMITTVGEGVDLETIIEKIKWPDKVKNLEMIGRHVSVKAWDKETEAPKTVIQNIMPVPSAASINDWEATAKAQQEKILNAN
jgi:phage terminase small subunit